MGTKKKANGLGLPKKHATHQRVKDEAKIRLGTKSRLMHFRLTEDEYEQLVAEATAHGTTKLSVYIRYKLMRTSGFVVSADSGQPLPAIERPDTQTAVAAPAELDTWLGAQLGHVTGPVRPIEAFVRPEPVSAPIARPEPPAAPAIVPPAPRARTPKGALSVANMGLLRELREVMGDDSHVDADLRAKLDGGPTDR